jgi:hypothetical protein
MTCPPHRAFTLQEAQRNAIFNFWPRPGTNAQRGRFRELPFIMERQRVVLILYHIDGFRECQNMTEPKSKAAY